MKSKKPRLSLLEQIYVCYPGGPLFGFYYGPVGRTRHCWVYTYSRGYDVVPRGSVFQSKLDALNYAG